MNTAIRVLVVVITLLGATALAFAILNFNKRLVLLTKVTMFVDYVVKVAQTIEAQDAETASVEKMKDVSDVTDQADIQVNQKNVFEVYAAQLEAQNLEKLKFAQKKDQLNTLYAVDDEGNVKKNSLGEKVMEGPGTMQELLEQLFERSKTQVATLDKTRQALAKTRDLVEESIDEINTLKAEGRLVKKDLKERKEDIVRLEGDKTRLQGEIATLKSEKSDLEAEVVDKVDQIERLEETQAKMGETLVSKELMITNLVGIIADLRKVGGGGQDIFFGNFAISAGEKGKIIESDDEYKFAIIELSPAAMMEMLGQERDKPLPQVDLNVRRSGRETIVTKIKLRHYVKDKNVVVADILTDWQQYPVEKGDVVFF